MINVFNLLILLGIMIPNIIYAISVQDIKPKKREKEELFADDSVPERTAIEEILYAEDKDGEENRQEAAQAGEENQQGGIQAKKKARWKRLDFWIGIIESLGRYACMILMIVPFGVLKFEFSNKENFMIYTVGNIALLVAYWLVWSLFLKKRTFKRAIILAILPTCIFLLTGLTLDHWWLVLASLVFGVCHAGITLESVWEE